MYQLKKYILLMLKNISISHLYILVLLCLIFISINGSSLHALTLSDISPDCDVPSHTYVNTPEEFDRAVSIGISHLQPQIILNSTFSDLNLLANLLKQHPELSKYTIQCLETGSKNVLTLSLEYKQTYKLINAQTSLLAQDRLDLSDLKLLDISKQILKDITLQSMTPYQKELAIHDYIINTTAYAYNTGSTDPSIYTAAGVLLNHHAVCEGYSEATKLLLDLINIPCKIIYGNTVDGRHAWNLIQLDNEWYHLDVTFDDPITKKNNTRIETLTYDYFNLTDQQIMTDHTWDHTKYPSSQGTKYNYFTQNKNSFTNYNDFKSYVIHQIKLGNKEILCYVTHFSRSNYDLSFILDYCNRFSYSLPTNANGSIKITIKS